MTRAILAAFADPTRLSPFGAAMVPLTADRWRIEILAGAELRRIHEDAHEDGQTLGPSHLGGGADEGLMAAMQGTHRGHEDARTDLDQPNRSR